MDAAKIRLFSPSPVLRRSTPDRDCEPSQNLVVAPLDFPARFSQPDLLLPLCDSPGNLRGLREARIAAAPDYGPGSLHLIFYRFVLCLGAKVHSMGSPQLPLLKGLL